MKNSNRTFLSIFAIVVVLATLGGCEPVQNQAVDGSASQPIKIIETGEGFLVTEGEQRILFYQRKPKSIDGKYTRANYIHPLYGLDGEILTEDFPSDDLHHRGIFWTWHQVYIGDRRMGDAWLIEDFSWDVYDAKILMMDSQSRAL